MDDFLYILKLQLLGRLTLEQIDEQMELYQNYIEEQLAGGMTLEQVMRKLGDPSEIADLIVEAYEKKLKQEDEAAGKENMKNLTADEINAMVHNPEHGFHAEFKPDTGWDIRLGKIKLNSWYGTFLILGIVLAIFVLLSHFIPGLRIQ